MLTFQDAIGVLWTARLNIELLLTSDADGDLYINMRARPWKNGAHDGYMLLVGAYTLDDALVLVADAFENEGWRKLDWTARVLPLASPARNVRQFPTEHATPSTENHQEGRWVPKSYKDLNDDLKGR